MTEIQFKEFTEEIIPQQLFHVDPKDVDNESGGKLEEVILVGLIAHNIECLKYKPLQWFLDKFLIKNDLEQPTLKQEAEFGSYLQGQIEEELERQLIEDYDCMISTDDFFPSSEEELFRQIHEDN
jgi:hypothetical protein